MSTRILKYMILKVDPKDIRGWSYEHEEEIQGMIKQEWLDVAEELNTN